MAINDFNIGFLAGLDGTKSKAKLNQDIDAIKKSLKELELKAKLDPNQVKALENQLNSLKVSLTNVSFDQTSLNNLVSQINNSLSGIKLQIPNLNTSNAVGQAQKAGQQIGQQIQNGMNSVIQKGSFEKIFRASGDGINNVSKDAEAYFKTLSNTVSVQERLGTNNNLTSFTVSLKNAEGVAEQLNYQLKKITDDKGTVIDRYFEYTGGSINDNGVIKQMNAISAKADSLQTKLDKLKANYLDTNASRPIKDASNISALSQQYDKVTKSIENVRNADNSTFSSMVSNAQKEITTLETMVSQFRNAENVATQMKSVDISSGIAQAQERLGKLKANASGFEQMKQTIIDLDSAIAKVGDKSSLDAFINKLKVAESQLGRVKAEARTMATEQQRLSLANTIEAWNQKNTAATRAVREENERYVVSLRDLNTQMTKIDFNKINTGFKQNENSMRALNRLGASLKNQWIQATQSFTMWLSASRLVMTVMTKLRQMPQTVKELDTSLVDLKKTTSMTTSQLEDFYYAANDVAKQMGVTTKEIIDQASAWSRLGYSSQEAATKMAKYSSMFASISPGMDVDTATNGLVSIMKAFDIGNDNPDDVLDGIMSKVNIIGNTAATSNAEIVNMLSKSSSAMKEANNTLEETIALETAAVEITRDDDSVGTAFKTLSMRIRGYDEETESYTNNVEELSGKIADLTKTASTPGGISLFTDDAKTEYKSTYQLLSEISKVYDQLTDKNQAQLLEVLAGKRQGQIVAATINNFQAAEKAMDNMAKSAGNAEAEMSVIMDSLDYKLNKNKETWTGVAQNLFQREDMKAIVDAFTSIGEAVDFATDKLGLFGTIGLGAGIFAGFKNVGRLKMQSLIVLNCRQ